MKIVLALFLFFLASGCGRKEELHIPPPRRRSVEIEEPEEIRMPDYTYGGSAYRSPFTPAPRRRRGEEEVTLKDINLEGLRVTGIISDARSKYALLSAPGESYVARGGRLIDEDDRPVPGVAVVIKEDKIVLITEDEKTIEIDAPRW